MSGLKVLITGFRFAERSGLEVYIQDLALELQKRGHIPIVYSPILGDLAAELRGRTIPVVDDLNQIATVPDIIHGHHHMETMSALLHFPGVPAMYSCHDWFSGLDSPPRFPRLLRFTAVDQPCYEKLVFEHGVPEDRVRLVLSFVDLERFKVRTPLPTKPKKALLYSSYAEDDAFLTAIRIACAQAGLELDVVGSRAGNTSSEPEKLLAQYDLVFAKARSAAEALATGTAVIIYCLRSLGPMVTSHEIERLLSLNFGFRTMTHYSSPEKLAVDLRKQIDGYDAEDACKASHKVRERLSSERSFDQILGLYEEVIAENKTANISSPLEEARAAAAYIQWLAPQVKEPFNDRVIAMVAPLLSSSIDS